MFRRWSFSAFGPALVIAFAGACSKPEGPRTRASSAPVRNAATSPTSEIQVAASADPRALQELVSASPTATPESTGPDGGTLVGSESAPSASPATATVTPEPTSTASAEPSAAKLYAGPLDVQPTMSNPAIERAAREQIYWPLVQKCRGPDGEILPPDSITLRFTIRADGTVDPASVDAEADRKQFQSAAQCIVREFSSIPFQGPPSSLGATTRINARLPSVD